MKPIKVYWNGKRLRDVNPHATTFQVIKWKLYRFFRKLGIATITVTALYVMFLIGKVYSVPLVTYAVQETSPQTETAVMTRIAKCESGGSQYDKNGQVIFNGNKDKSVDIGYYQINNYHWGAKAKSMNLDLTKEEDNKKMGEWIYENIGTSPWSSSSKCWSQ